MEIDVLSHPQVEAARSEVEKAREGVVEADQLAQKASREEKRLRKQAGIEEAEAALGEVEESGADTLLQRARREAVKAEGAREKSRQRTQAAADLEEKVKEEQSAAAEELQEQAAAAIQEKTERLITLVEQAAGVNEEIRALFREVERSNRRVEQANEKGDSRGRIVLPHRDSSYQLLTAENSRMKRWKSDLRKAGYSVDEAASE